MMRSIAALLCAGLLMSSAGPARADDRALEQYLLGVPTADSALRDATRINQESHYAGTPGDYHIAMWMRDRLIKAGFDAKLEAFPYDVPFLLRAEISIQNGKHPTHISLAETPIPSDPDGSRKDAGQPFNAWSASGDVQAAVIDAGHGLDADYRALGARSINPRGSILLIRYGREFRGLLAKRAQDHGASGVIFFSDPADRDGSQRGPAYPDGPYRPLGAVQRGSLEQGQITIPTLPVTATAAAQLIANMRNGISTAPVRFTVKMVLKHATLWNTVGLLVGKDPTHQVIIGAHRDAWVYGVTDNGDGISNVLEAARALGYIYQSGWRPQYSVVIVGFDGEEIGEVGSKTYVRMHHDALESGALAYINDDESETGKFFGASAAAALENLMLPAAWTVKDPAQQGQPLASRWNAQPGGAQIRGPAGGSDFESFLYDVGTPVMDFGFQGVFGVYHSPWDDLNYVQTQADPGWVNHNAVAQLVALLAMRIASGAPPYRLAAYAPRMRAALSQLSSGSSSPADFSPLVASIGRFASAASRADNRGADGNQEIAIVHRLDKLFYGRNGYAPVAFPWISDALAQGNQAALSAAIGRASHDLDDISSAIAGATH
jgi:N-acetylated-alpha-linked acidic dipeptidase